jgi:hypothetical protein
MAIIIDPNIASSGLLMSIDAANTRSYAGSGNTWYDLSSNLNDATKVNSPNYIATAGGGFTFDGLGTNYFNLDSKASLVNVNAGTVGGWVKFNNAPTSVNYVFISYGGNASSGGFILDYLGQDGPNYGICFDYWVGGVYYGNAITYANSAQFTNINIHLMASWNASQINLYINGNLLKTTNVSGTMTTQSTLRISSENNRTRGVNGTVYNCSIYNRALSASEIKNNFEATRDRYGI